MISQVRKKIIRKKVKSGSPIGELKIELRNEGYTDAEINDCFEKNKADMRSWYLLFGMLFFIVGIWVIMKYNDFWLIILGGTLILLFFKEVDKRNN